MLFEVHLNKERAFPERGLTRLKPEADVFKAAAGAFLFSLFQLAGVEAAAADAVIEAPVALAVGGAADALVV